jgi:hypothetical protein
MEKAHHINFKTIEITVMKTLKYLIPLMLLGVFTLTSCSKTETTTPQNGLSELEKTNLRLMREEEKLARDVYLYAHDLYGTQIFSNISNSEQIHMDKMLELLTAYNLEDPSHSDFGKFNNPDLQLLYTTLTTQCDISLDEALNVGATIEDLDIFDLDEAIKSTSRTDILEAYTLLKCGSENHMRAFSKQLNNRGETYTPQFISQDTYDAILQGTNGPCQ